MDITQKKAFCRQLIDTVWNAGKVDAFDKFVVPNSRYIDPSASFETTSLEELKKYALSVRKAFPDLNLKVEDQIAEGDKVVSFITVTATHEGDFLGVSPSHKKTSLPLVLIQRFAGDKIAEGFCLWDVMTLLRTAGAFEIHEPALGR